MHCLVSAVSMRLMLDAVDWVTGTTGLQPSVDVPFQSPRHSYGIRCDLIFSHLHPYLFSVNAYKHFYSGNHFLILYCDATTPLWSL